MAWPCGPCYHCRKDHDYVWSRRDEFRALAQRSADQARKLLASNDERSVIYAALELRLGLEALIYGHAINYLDELGDLKRLDWQAPKLLERLLEIDPFADSTVFIREVDDQTGEYRDIGSEARLDFKKLKKRYYKLGNALHAPSIVSLLKGEANTTDWRAECGNIIEVIDEVLASTATVPGGTHYPVFQMDCACGTLVKRRTDPLFVHRGNPAKGAASIKVRCTKCIQSAEVSLSEVGDHFEVVLDQLAFDCPHEGCGKRNGIWEAELEDGHKMDCVHCKGAILMSAALRPVVV